MPTLANADTGTWAQQWGDTFLSAISDLWSRVAAFTPNLLGMLVILALGYIVSKIIQRIATAVLVRVGFDKASRKIGIRTLLDRAGVPSTASVIVGRLVFWLFMLTFMISAAEALGLENVSHTIDSFVAYLPNVIGAVVILIVGLLVARFVRDLLRSGAEGVGVEYGTAIAQLGHGVMVVVVVTLAIGQLKVETELISRVIEIILMAAGAALALALGLGTRDLAKHIVAGVYARDLFRRGTRLVVGDDRGAVHEVGTVTTSIRTDEGRLIHVPNGQLLEMIVHEDGVND